MSQGSEVESDLSFPNYNYGLIAHVDNNDGWVCVCVRRNKFVLPRWDSSNRKSACLRSFELLHQTVDAFE